MWDSGELVFLHAGQGVWLSELLSAVSVEDSSGLRSQETSQGARRVVLCHPEHSKACVVPLGSYDRREETVVRRGEIGIPHRHWPLSRERGRAEGMMLMRICRRSINTHGTYSYTF